LSGWQAKVVDSYKGKEVAMHASSSIHDWMRVAHDSGGKVVRFTGHLLHEKSFWAILAIVVALAGLFALVAYFGNDASMRDFNMPMPYGVYY
jgi:hypothetical protein